ncbi:MAG: glucose-1-phosphate cytidylyltransferase [Verrucomicrobia bacterium]|nr:glucose-1-phosphate cytidylyltransferase [Verrucomicrobiota bacterium]
MKVAILAGGQGSRLAEETHIRPKPLVEIGGKPILWHIMNQYDHFGHKDFFIALGYKGEMIKRYFVDFCSLSSDIQINLKNGAINRHQDDTGLDWNVNLIDTGINSMTGGRIKRLEPYLNDGTFMLTWGDGVSNIDLKKLVEFHKSHGKLATLTAVRPPARYGHLNFDGDKVSKFSEKPQTAEGWINGAFFVLEPEIFNYIENDATQWEKEPMERLAEEGQLMAYRHGDFWQCMDTLREKHILEQFWQSGNAPWAYPT